MSASACETSLRPAASEPRIGARRRASVYLASPVSVMEAPRCDTALAIVNEALPNAAIVEHQREFFDTAAWLIRWPAMLRTLGAIVFFPAADGTIGAGVAREIMDGLARGIPVRFLDLDGDIDPPNRGPIPSGNRCLHDSWRYLPCEPNQDDRFGFVRFARVVAERVP